MWKTFSFWSCLSANFCLATALPRDPKHESRSPSLVPRVFFLLTISRKTSVKPAQYGRKTSNLVPQVYVSYYLSLMKRATLESSVTESMLIGKYKWLEVKYHSNGGSCVWIAYAQFNRKSDILGLQIAFSFPEATIVLAALLMLTKTIVASGEENVQIGVVRFPTAWVEPLWGLQACHAWQAPRVTIPESFFVGG